MSNTAVSIATALTSGTAGLGALNDDLSDTVRSSNPLLCRRRDWLFSPRIVVAHFHHGQFVGKTLGGREEARTYETHGHFSPYAQFTRYRDCSTFIFHN